MVLLVYLPACATAHLSRTCKHHQQLAERVPLSVMLGVEAQQRLSIITVLWNLTVCVVVDVTPPQARLVGCKHNSFAVWRLIVNLAAF